MSLAKSNLNTSIVDRVWIVVVLTTPMPNKKPLDALDRTAIDFMTFHYIESLFAQQGSFPCLVNLQADSIGSRFKIHRRPFQELFLEIIPQNMPHRSPQYYCNKIEILALVHATIREFCMSMGRNRGSRVTRLNLWGKLKPPVCARVDTGIKTTG